MGKSNIKKEQIGFLLETESEEIKTNDPVCETCGLKPTKTFFDGAISEHFKGKKLYIGDMDFRFADDNIVVNAEIKYVNSKHKFVGKKMTLLQAREYASTNDTIDNLGRTHKSYLFEAHEVEKPYVAIVPFLNPTGKEKHAIEFLDVDNARLVYVHKDNQFGRWLAGDRYVGTSMRNPLKCV